MQNINNQEALAKLIYNSYAVPQRMNCAGFIYEQTKLFRDEWEKPFKPYFKQIEFMNGLKKEDRVVVILKPRQCITGDSYINLINEQKTIKELYESKYRGQCYSTNSFNQMEEDKIVDIWEAGIKPVYEIKLNNGYKIKSTLEHKFNTEDKGYLKLSELKVGDKLQIQNNNSSLENSVDSFFERSKNTFSSFIESIEYVGKEMTYDLTTEIFHNYFANGINVHNSGFSTAIVGRVVYESYFNLVPEICIISATRDQANKVLDRIKKAFKSMHESIQPKFTKDNEGLLELANGVKIYSLSSNPDSVRGYTGNVYLDEFAMISAKDSNEIYSAVYPTITKGGRLVIVSTPKGKRGKFYELITKSLQDINGKSVVKANKVIYKLDWRDVPHIKFAVEEMGLFDGMTPDEILQEYELTFSNDDENPFLTVDFILEKLIEKDRIIPTFSSYSDLLIPKEYFDDITTQNPKPLEKAYYIRNNPELKHLFEEYHRFFATHDPASVNDDSVFKVFGQRENGSWDIVFKADLKKIDSDLIVQSKYLKRIFDCFQCEKICIDYTGLGRAVGDFLNNLDDMNLNENLFFFESERNIKVDLYTSLKNMISEGRLKRNFDGSKSDQDEINQYSHVYYRDGKMYKKSGTKDDHADGDMLLCYLIEDDFVDGGIILI